jgi:hypothetical protein
MLGIQHSARNSGRETLALNMERRFREAEPAADKTRLESGTKEEEESPTLETVYKSSIKIKP